MRVRQNASTLKHYTIDVQIVAGLALIRDAEQQMVVKSDSQETYDLMTLFRESFTAPVALGRATDWPGGIRTR